MCVCVCSTDVSTEWVVMNSDTRLPHTHINFAHGSDDVREILKVFPNISAASFCHHDPHQIGSSKYIYIVVILLFFFVHLFIHLL